MLSQLLRLHSVEMKDGVSDEFGTV